MHAFSVPGKPQSAPAASDEIVAAAKDGEGSSPGSSASDNEQGVFMSLAKSGKQRVCSRPLHNVASSSTELVLREGRPCWCLSRLLSCCSEDVQT